MKPVLVSGLINIETTLRIDRFPLPYAPVHFPFFGVHTTVSGVGYNIGKALRTLGLDVTLLSLVGRDGAGRLARDTLTAAGLDGSLVLPQLAATAQSVILYEESGRRQIHVDLKDIQEQRYPEARFRAALTRCDLAVLANINFSRPFLSAARGAGKLVASDVHTIDNLEDAYNRDFMAAADILFMSDEALPLPPTAWAREVMARYSPAVLVIGLGSAGALLAVRDDGFVGCFPAVSTRPVVNTIGAGDALFSAFLATYLRSGDPYLALRKAIVFASYKVGTAGAADGFLDAPALDEWYGRIAAATAGSKKPHHPR